jgi:hypothetical protein
MRFMVSVVIAAPSGAASIGTAGLMDALNKADAAARLQGGPAAPRVFEVRLAGLEHGPVVCRDGVILQPSVAAADVGAPDLVVVPGLDDELAASFAANRGWAPILEPGAVPGRAFRRSRPRQPGRQGPPGRRAPFEPASVRCVRPAVTGQAGGAGPGAGYLLLTWFEQRND